MRGECRIATRRLPGGVRSMVRSGGLVAASLVPARLQINGNMHMLASRPDQGRQATTPLGVAGTGFRPNLYDAVIFLLVVGVFVLVAHGFREMNAPAIRLSTEPVTLDVARLPEYALRTTLRMFAAIIASLVFTFVVATLAARNRKAELVILPALDILQSVPVLGFLTFTVTFFLQLFPGSVLGAECAAIFAIFTSQAWNMAFSFYQSLKTVPKELDEVSRGFGMNWSQRLRWVELPYATPGLVWNSMVSVANGWFFLMAAEAFKLGTRDFRLPGLGAYMSVAVDQGNVRAQIFAIAAMLILVILLDQIVWKPVVAWSQRFQMDDAVRVEKHRSWLLRLLRRSELWMRVRHALTNLIPKRQPRPLAPADIQEEHTAFQRVLGGTMLILVLLALALGGIKLLGVLTSISTPEWLRLLKAGGASMGRVLCSTLLATCWTLPIGLWIGLSPTWSRRLQPFVQVVASFPASILFVALIVALQRVGVNLFSSSILLMTLSTQWYLLFNIIAGAQAVPMNLREAAKAYRFGIWRTSWKLYFPAIFPFLVTGWVTATGGAWNASIITEIVQVQGQTHSTFGLGAIVTQAAGEENIPLLAAAAILMAILVVLFNRLVWAPLYRLAETRYSLNQ